MDLKELTIFDRQIKMLGIDGQQRLLNSHICFINVSRITIEMIRECLLYGIGNITIISEQLVDENGGLLHEFYMLKNDVGKFVVDIIPTNMSDINNCTKFRSIHDNPKYMFDNDPSFFEQFNVVVFTQYFSRKFNQLLLYLYTKNIYAIHIGLICGVGTIEPQYRNLFVIEPLPEFKPSDLRLLEPFKELYQYYESFDLQNHIPKDIHIIPYPILVIDALNLYIKTFGTIEELTQEVRDRLIELLNSKYIDMKTSDNFKEAFKHIKNGLGYFPSNKFPVNLEKLIKFHNEQVHEKDNFWLILSGISSFVTIHNRLPFTISNLEEISTSTSYYQQIKQLYKDRFRNDIHIIYNIVVTDHHIDNTSQLLDDISVFCENLFYVDYITTYSIPNRDKDYLTQLIQTTKGKFVKLLHCLTDNDIEHNLKDYAINKCHMKCDEEQCHTLNYASCVHLAGIATFELIKICSRKYTPIKSQIFVDTINGILWP